MDNLQFRRQFLFTAKECSELKHWNIENLGTHYLYTHPDCETTRISKIDLDLILIGHVVNPKFPNHTTSDILKEISNATTIDEVSNKIYGLVGRFILLVKKDNKYTFFHDACGLKILFYTKYNNELYTASQPLLLKLVTDVQEGVNYQEYYASPYVKETLEHWIPSGTSLYEDVYQLVPNHYLDSSDFKQVRYWPVESLERETLENSVEKFATILEQTMLAANNRFKLALPLTAGWDSRIILGSCKDISENIWSYTLKYRNLTAESNDIRIPTKLSQTLGFQHKVIDCIKPLDKKFAEIYTHNTDIPHINDWGKIAYGMYEDYPADRMAVKGNCSEVGRCFYFPTGKHSKINSCDDFLKLEPLWGDIDFVRKEVSQWFEEINPKTVNFDYDLYDLFYWEHRMGSWQAQSQLEWDIVQETFSPFNNRELFDIMLSIDPLYRRGTKNVLFKKAMEKLWPEALSEPINPLTKKQKSKNMVKSILVKVGIFNTLKSTIKKQNKK